MSSFEVISQFMRSNRELSILFLMLTLYLIGDEIVKGGLFGQRRIAVGNRKQKTSN